MICSPVWSGCGVILASGRRTGRRANIFPGRAGTSIEFSDYRDYVAGDDLRYVDWNVFSRLNQPYLKLYAHEEEMQVPILLDASNSMNFEGKFDLAGRYCSCVWIWPG